MPENLQRELIDLRERGGAHDAQGEPLQVLAHGKRFRASDSRFLGESELMAAVLQDVAITQIEGDSRAIDSILGDVADEVGLVLISVEDGQISEAGKHLGRSFRHNPKNPNLARVPILAVGHVGRDHEQYEADAQEAGVDYTSGAVSTCAISKAAENRRIEFERCLLDAKHRLMSMISSKAIDESGQRKADLGLLKLSGDDGETLIMDQFHLLETIDKLINWGKALKKAGKNIEKDLFHEIAHEMNNSLMVIICFCELMQNEEISEDSKTFFEFFAADFQELAGYIRLMTAAFDGQITWLEADITGKEDVNDEKLDVPRGIKVCVIDDTMVVLESCKRKFEAAGAKKVVTASDFAEAVEILGSEHFDLVLLDHKLGGGKYGFDILRGAHLTNGALVVVQTSNSLASLRKGGAYGNLPIVNKRSWSEVSRLLREHLQAKEVEAAPSN